MASNASAMRAEDRFNLDPELSYTLPGHYYYDREIFEREKEEIWSKTWQLVGYGADLKEPGDYITNDILDQKVFVTRAKDGRLRAFYNVCMHRGHILLEGKGNVRMITCPFHAWTYDLEGNLKAAGNSENVVGFDAGDFCLPEIQVEELLNMVFVNLDAQAASLASMVPGFAEDVRATVPYFDELVLARHDDYANFKCNWKFIPDQNECYHCPHLHPDVMGSEDSYMEPSWESTEYDYWAKHFILSNRNVKEEHKPYDFGPDAVLLDVNIWWLWPNLIFLAHQGPSNFKVTRVMPAGPEETHQTIDNFCLNATPNAYDVGTMDNYRDVVMPQDVSAMERQQLGVHARGYTQGRLMVDKERSWRSEHGTHHLDRLVWLAVNRPRSA